MAEEAGSQTGAVEATRTAAQLVFIALGRVHEFAGLEKRIRSRIAEQVGPNVHLHLEFIPLAWTDSKNKVIIELPSAAVLKAMLTERLELPGAEAAPWNAAVAAWLASAGSFSSRSSSSTFLTSELGRQLEELSRTGLDCRRLFNRFPAFHHSL